MSEEDGPPDRASTVVRQSGLTSIAATAAVASGLLLDVLIAARYGAGSATDALFVAARIPLGLGAILMVAANQALVPAFTSSLTRRGREETSHLVSTLLTGTVVLGLGLVGSVAITADGLMSLIAPGLSPERLAEAASLARILFLIVPLVGAAEILRAFLNARYSFIAPAAMHAVMNVVAAGILIGFGDRGIGVVAWAYVVGASTQLLFIFSMAAARNLRFRPSFAFRQSAVVHATRLSLRPLVGAGLNPLARVGEQLFVSFLPTGSITILNYGYRLISAIGGSILFRSVIVALVPRLTTATARERDIEIRRITRLGLRIMLFVSLPMTAVVAVLATPASLVLFHRGNFAADDARLLGLVLAVYAASFVGSAVQRALLAPFFARLDTKVPLRNTVYGIVANLLLVPICMAPFGRTDHAVVGVALAYSLAQYVNVVHAWLRLREIGIRTTGIASTGWRLAVASGMGAVAMVAVSTFLDLASSQGRWVLFGKLALTAIMGLATMAGTCLVLGVDEVRSLLGRMRRSVTDLED